MDEITRIKFPGDPLSETELEKLASITAKNQNEAIATADPKAFADRLDAWDRRLAIKEIDGSLISGTLGG